VKTGGAPLETPVPFRTRFALTALRPRSAPDTVACPVVTNPATTATMPRVKADCRHSGPLFTACPFSAPKNYTPDRSEALRVARP